MDPNNLNGISIRDDLDESDFCAVSSVGTDLKQILEKLKKLEAKSAINEGGSSSMFQIGEKYGEMKKEIAAMANEMEGMKAARQADSICAFEDLKKDLEKFGQENGQLKKEFVEKIAKMEGKMAEKDRQITELKKENWKWKEEVWLKLKIEIAEQKGQIAKLEDNNRAMKRKIERIETYFPNTKKVLINRRALPAELLNELFASLPMKNAFEILAKMPNGLLVRNMRKMFKSIEMEMRNNKWNEAQCGQKLAISEGGLVVKHSGPNRQWNCVRAQMAIPKFNLNSKNASIAYFEVEILKKMYSIRIGFCTQQFPLENNWVGNVENSIGIGRKEEMWIDGKGNYINFGNGGGKFQTGNVIGIGIVHYPAILSMKCFATLNGQLLGEAELPIKFADLQLFPALNLYYANDAIRVNFGSDSWRYNPQSFTN